MVLGSSPVAVTSRVLVRPIDNIVSLVEVKDKVRSPAERLQ